MHKILKQTHGQILLVFILLTIYVTGIDSQVVGAWTSPIYKCWDYPAIGMTNISLASDNEETLFLPLENGKIDAIDINGRRLWLNEFGGQITSRLHLNNAKNLLVVTNEDAKSVVQTIKTHSGTIESAKDLTGINFRYVFDKTEPDSRIFYNSDGKILSFDLENNMTWSRDLKTRITSDPIILGDKIGFGTSNRTFIQMDKIDGEIHSQINLKQIPAGKMVSYLGIIYIGDKVGNVHSIDLKTQKILWKAQTGAEIVEIIKHKESILISSNDNFIYQLNDRNGNTIWKKRLAGRIIGRSFVNEQIGIYLTYGTNIAILLDLESGKTLNKIILDEKEYPVSDPVILGEKIFIPTQNGISAFSSVCKKSL